MHIFQHQSQIIQNSAGRVQKSFRVVKGNGEKVMKLEGVSNRNDPSLYHILQTLRKNNMSAKRYYQIHEEDIVRLLKEGDRVKDLDQMKNYQKSEVKRVKREEKKGKKEEKRVKKVKKSEKEKEGKKIKKKSEKKRVLKK